MFFNLKAEFYFNKEHRINCVRIVFFKKKKNIIIYLYFGRIIISSEIKITAQLNLVG